MNIACNHCYAEFSVVLNEEGNDGDSINYCPYCGEDLDETFYDDDDDEDLDE